jgi:hypothetical protein
MVEYQANRLFNELLGPHPLDQGNDESINQKQGVGYAASLLLTYTLDLRKKRILLK